MSVKFFSGEQFADSFFSALRSDFLNMSGADDSGLIAIEQLKNCSAVSKLWRDRAMQISLNVRVQGSRRIPTSEYTPYLYALEYERDDLTAFILKWEAGFTKRFLSMKCDVLHRYEITGKYQVDQVLFGPSVDHATHHSYLIPSLCDSLERFFQEFKGERYWDDACTQELLETVRGALCTSCSTDFEKLTLRELREQYKGKLFFISDSESKVCDRRHWISFVFSDELIAIGNRGLGSGIWSGVCVYRFSEEMESCSVSQFIDRFQRVRPEEHLPMSKQWSGSCSRSSFEATTLGAAFLIFKKKCSFLCSSEVIARARAMVNEWIKDDRIEGITEIIKTDQEMQYDPKLLIRVLAVFQDCPKAAERFHHFLRNEKQVDWTSLNETMDTENRLPGEYVVNRDNALGCRWFRHEVEVIKRGSVTRVGPQPRGFIVWHNETRPLREPNQRPRGNPAPRGNPTGRGYKYTIIRKRWP